MDSVTHGPTIAPMMAPIPGGMMFGVAGAL
jgi:hypothetical protein